MQFRVMGQLFDACLPKKYLADLDHFLYACNVGCFCIVLAVVCFTVTPHCTVSSLACLKNYSNHAKDCIDT